MKKDQNITNDTTKQVMKMSLLLAADTLVDDILNDRPSPFTKYASNVDAILQINKKDGRNNQGN